MPGWGEKYLGEWGILIKFVLCCFSVHSASGSGLKFVM